MKRNRSFFDSSKKGARRRGGQAVAALVMALVLAVGGTGTTALLLSQPSGLTVEPVSQGFSWQESRSKKAAPQEASQEQAAPETESSAAAASESESGAAAEPGARAASPAETAPAEEMKENAPAAVQENPAAQPEQAAAEAGPEAAQPAEAAPEAASGLTEENTAELAAEPTAQESAQQETPAPPPAPAEGAGQTPAAPVEGDGQTPVTPENTEQPAAPAEGAGQAPVTPENTEQPAVPAEGSGQTPAAAPQPAQTEKPLLPARADAGQEDDENSFRLFQTETPELAAEDPMLWLEQRDENAAEPDENGAVLLTMDYLELEDSALGEEAALSLDEENCLDWLWEWLFGGWGREESYSGWRTEGGKTYYYDPSTHKALTGIQSIDGKLYYFDGDGVQQDVTFGIDVSKYQQNIDWEQVKQAGVEFVIVRIGYRGYGSGTLVLDPMFEEHFTNARNAGLRVGVYMFSQAVSEEEAREEAFACAYVLNGRTLDYPIYFDSEASGASNGSGRADGLGVTDRTACAVAFCEEVKANGYQPGVYASTSWFANRLDLSALAGYSIWNAHYGVASSSMDCDLWQGSCEGRISGYNGSIDVNISYIG